MKIGMFDGNCYPFVLGDKVELINGQRGEIVFECGAFGVAIPNFINYEKLQIEMDKLDVCCNNSYHGCFNDNFISLWELYWNFNCEDDILYPVEKY